MNIITTVDLKALSMGSGTKDIKAPTSNEGVFVLMQTHIYESKLLCVWQLVDEEDGDEEDEDEDER
jgi:hypothetical protein